jgi:hypothetical protein
MSKSIFKWLANGRVGESSKTMALTALGEPPKCASYPLDPDDLNRCLLLLKAAPEVRDAFPEIAKLSPVWEAFIFNWEILESLFLEEVGLDWCKARRATRTYERMKEVRMQADEQYARAKMRAGRTRP